MNTDTSTALAPISEIETKVNATIALAESLAVSTPQTLQTAADYIKQCNDRIKEIGKTFDPICDSTNKAHKEATGKRKSFLEPVEKAKEIINKKVSEYDIEIKKQIAEADRIAREKAQESADDIKIEAATASEVEGNHEAAEAIVTEKAAPIHVAAVRKSTPKGMHMRANWKYRITDIHAIPREYMVANEPFLAQTARTTKGMLAVAGVEFYNEPKPIVK